MSSAPSELYTTLYNTATKALLSHSQEELRRNVHSLSANLSQDCRRFFAPAAYMTALGEQDGLTNEAYEKLVAWQITIVDKWSVEITEVLVDEAKRSAMIWGKYTSTLKEPEQTFHLEFVQILHMNESGTAAHKVVEFLDTAEAKRFDDALQEKKG